MSLDPLVTIILLIYVITVLAVLVIWFAITLGSRNSWFLTQVAQPAKGVQTKARVKREPSHLPTRKKQKKAKRNDGFNSYAQKRRQQSLEERNFRVFSREVPLPDHGKTKEPLVANKSSSQPSRKQNNNDSEIRSLDVGKNFSASSKSSQKLSNDQLRGESAKKQRSYSSMDMNFDEDFLKDFAKNKK